MARTFDVACSVRVTHTLEDLSAHVELDGDVVLEPGDQVRVHGDPIVPPVGEVCEERRLATVTRASWLERTWTRLTGDLRLLSLIE